MTTPHASTHRLVSLPNLIQSPNKTTPHAPHMYNRTDARTAVNLNKPKANMVIRVTYTSPAMDSSLVAGPKDSSPAMSTSLSPESVSMERQPPRRTGSFPIRVMVPQPPHPAAVEAAPTSSGSRFASPFNRKAASDSPRKIRQGDDPSAAALARSLWPSTSSRKSGTLADHIGNDRLIDLAEGRGGDPAPPERLTRQRSSTEFSRFDDYKDRPPEPNGRRSSKENRPMRYLGKLGFPRSSSSKFSHGSGASATAPGRMSVDENAVTTLRRRSDITSEPPEPRHPPAQRAALKAGLYEQKSGDGLPTAKVITSESMLRKSNSYRTSTTQWALSPGRPASPPASSRRTPLSGLRPASPGKSRGMGNFISNLGLDLFRKKPSAGGALLRSSSSPSLGVGSSTMRSTRGGAGMGEAGHQFRLLHNRLIQWQYLNARSDAVNHIKSLHAETMLVHAWFDVSKLQASVAQKQVRLEKEKLALKVNTILSSQMRALDGWANMERQHLTALSTTRNCLQSVVCRVPLIEGAEVDPRALTVELREALDLASTIKRTISMFTPMSQSTVPFLFELAEIVSREKSLLEECFELLGLAATLQLQEESLKCHLFQLDSLLQQEILDSSIRSYTNPVAMDLVEYVM